MVITFALHAKDPRFDPWYDYLAVGSLFVAVLNVNVYHAAFRAGFSGACRPPLAWHVLRPLPCPRRFLAKATRVPAPGAQVFDLVFVISLSPFT